MRITGFTTFEAIRDAPLFGAAYYGTSLSSGLERDKFLAMLQRFSTVVASQQPSYISWRSWRDALDPRSSAIRTRALRPCLQNRIRCIIPEEVSLIVADLPLSRTATAYVLTEFDATWKPVRGYYLLPKATFFIKETPRGPFDANAIVKLFVGLFGEMKEFLSAECGCLHYFASGRPDLYPPRQGDTPALLGLERPLLTTVGRDRAHGRLAHAEWRPWTGEPFNLFWGNIWRREFMEKKGLLECISALGFGRYSSLEDMGDRGGVCAVGEDHLFLKLPCRIRDVADPDGNLGAIYEALVQEMLIRDCFHPGMCALVTS